MLYRDIHRQLLLLLCAIIFTSSFEKGGFLLQTIRKEGSAT
jgi:hypothetical protein